MVICCPQLIWPKSLTCLAPPRPRSRTQLYTLNGAVLCKCALKEVPLPWLAFTPDGRSLVMGMKMCVHAPHLRAEGCPSLQAER